MPNYSKIAKIEYIGVRNLWDIEIDSPDHIFYANGIATSNSHAVSYAYLSYWSAYVKRHRILKFYKEWLAASYHKPEPKVEIKQLVTSAKIDGVEILPPSVTYGETDFFIRGEDIVFGLSHIKYVSEKELEKLFAFDQSYNEFDLFIKIVPKINSRTIGSLIATGCFSHMKKSRAYLKHVMDCLYPAKGGLTDKEIDWLSSKTFKTVKEALVALMPTKKEGGGTHSVKRKEAILEVIKRLDNAGRDLKDIPSVVASIEEELMGVTLCGSYLIECMDADCADTTCKDFLNGKGGKMTIVGEIVEIKFHTIKKKGNNEGKQMAFLKIADDTCEIDNVVVFPDKFELYSPVLYEKNTVAIFGEREKGKDSLIVDKVGEV